MAHPVILQLWAHQAVLERCQCAATNIEQNGHVNRYILCLLSIVQLPEQRVLSMFLSSIAGYCIAQQRHLGQLKCNMTVNLLYAFTMKVHVATATLLTTVPYG